VDPLYKDKTITVVIPCLNEEEAIGKVLDDVPDFVENVIVVDNNSTDRTPDIARQRGATVIQETVRGYGRAYKTGFSKATGDIIVTLDGDHSYPVHDLKRVLDIFFQYDVDFLSCCRFPVMDADAMSFKHWIGNQVLSLVMSVLYKTPIEDSQSGMWVFYRNILDKIKLRSDGMPLSEEIKIEAIRNRDIRFKEEHIKYSARSGEIKLRPWRDGMRNLLFLFRKRLFP